MERMYENGYFYKKDRSEQDHAPTEAETEDDIYMNTQQPQQQQQCTKVKKCTASSSFDYKIIIIISALGPLCLGALSSLCVVGILYHNKVVSTQILSEMYANATAALMVLKDKVDETESMYVMQEVKLQKLVSACNETDRLYKELNTKYHELVSAYSDTEQLYKMLEVKNRRNHEHLSVCTANQNCKLCEEGWKPLGLKCYYFSTEKLNWTQSRDYCMEKGGHLVIITSQTEQDFVSLKAGETRWIGLNDLETEGKWMWVNNQPLTETGVTFWFSAPGGPNEPDNWKKEDPSGENCAALGHESGMTHKWFDASCRKLKRFICEK